MKPFRPRFEVVSSRARLLFLCAFAALVLGGLVARTEVVFPDALRYIDQARRLERGDWSKGVRGAVDHPLYPLAVARVHRLLRSGDHADDWQRVAQLTSALAGVLLAVPCLLVARELFGHKGALLGVLLVYVSPVPTHVFADALSESTFLLFWTWGFWAAVRYLREGSLPWLVPAVVLSGLAYLTRPEGLFLPLALTATLAASPLTRATRLPWGRWWGAVLTIGIGGLLTVGPFVALKGGLGTKPAVARFFGSAPASRADAVEREHPLDPSETAAQTAALALRGAYGAVRGAVSLGLLPFAGLGLIAGCKRRGAVRARAWLLLGVVSLGWFLALVRLHATGGYCTPRHALILALPLFAAAGSGLRVASAWLVGTVGRRGLSPAWVPYAAALLLTASGVPELVRPLNAGYGGYRDAGLWLTRNARDGDGVVDVTGWSLFYAGRGGYTFANLHDAPADPALRWVVARDAHLAGPWGYCRRLEALVAGSRVVAQFPEKSVKGMSRVTVFERPAGVAVQNTLNRR